MTATPHDDAQADATPGLTLDQASAAAIDAAFESGYDEQRAPAHVRGLFGLLSRGDTAPDPLLARVTAARVARHASTDAAHDRAVHAPIADDQLSQQDRAALAAWLDNAGHMGDVPASLRERAGIIAGMAGLVASGGEAPTTGLASRTLARIDAAQREQSAAMTFRPGAGRRGLRFNDLVAAAAVLLLGAAVTMPVLSTMRRSSIDAACEANMLATAAGMGAYANDNTDLLPMVTAGFDSTWLDVGSRPERSNSANLFNLVRTGHNSVAELACPGNPQALTTLPSPDATDWRKLSEVSYSYQIMDRPRRLMNARALDGSPQIVLADRSPVILRVVARQPINPIASSPNHDERGQHVLRSDGSTERLSTPVDNQGDNIWLPREVEDAIWQARTTMGVIEGHEAPSSPTDVFLGP